MKVRNFGSLSRRIPVVGQGAYGLAEEGFERRGAQKALLHGIDLGMVHIDTAEMYGRSEEVIGEALQGVDRRDLFIVSKVLPSHGTYKGTIEACERSLKRLRTDYLDCYLLHWRDRENLPEVIGAFEELQASGKILSFGVSNFYVDDLEEALPLLTKYKIVCNQVHYNIKVRRIERDLLGFCEKHNIAVVAYTPLGERPKPGSKAAKAFQQIAEKHSATITQIILAFGIRHENVFTIPKASNIQHLEENAGANSIQLDDDDMKIIDQFYPPAAD